MKTNVGEATNFLERWAPEGPWVLTAIQTDKKGIYTRTFYPKDIVDLGRWLTTQNGARNIYFHVNPVTRDLDKKAEREDIKALAWLHVDIDPRAGENLEEERERALGLLTKKLPEGVPVPTVIVFSGGGYQGFWKLQEPLPVEGDVDKAEDAKRYNQQLETLFGADHCHNIDRIMRLPGTVNWPDPKKAKKGRVPVLAELVQWNDDAVYPITAFTPHQGTQMKEEGLSGHSAPKVKVSGNVERVQELSELDQWNVPDRVKVIIAQGRHPDEPPKKDDSRSEWLFDVVCNLARCKVPDDVIFALITDPDWTISESVLDKGSNLEKYAIRQIQRAKEEAEDPWLRKLNDQFAVIENFGGRCVVVEEIFDYSLKRSRLTKQAFTDFRNRLMNQRVQIGVDDNGIPKFKEAGKWWLEHQDRRQYRNIVFVPGTEVQGSYNLWKGFSVEARPGSKHELFLEHVLKNICSDNQEYYSYLVKWMATAIQHPARPGQVAVVMRGKQGTGKSFFASEFGGLFGRHFMQVSDPKHLVGSFNSHLRDVCVLFGDEAFYAGDKKHESVLKTLITEDHITIEAKGVDAETAPNYVHLMLASNNDWVIPAGGEERRYFVLDVADARMQQAEYFAAIKNALDEGGRENLLHYLLNLDLKGFDVRFVPKTAALNDQKEMSLSPEHEWWLNKLEEGQVFGTDGEWKNSAVKDDLFKDLTQYLKDVGGYRRVTKTSMNRFLQKIAPGTYCKQRLIEVEVDTGGGYSIKKRVRAYVWELPSLQDCRKEWTKLYGKTSWPEVVQELELPKPSVNQDPF